MAPSKPSLFMIIWTVLLYCHTHVAALYYQSTRYGITCKCVVLWKFTHWLCFEYTTWKLLAAWTYALQGLDMDNVRQHIIHIQVDCVWKGISAYSMIYHTRLTQLATYAAQHYVSVERLRCSWTCIYNITWYFQQISDIVMYGVDMCSDYDKMFIASERTSLMSFTCSFTYCHRGNMRWVV